MKTTPMNVMETKNGYIVAGAYEDRAELMNQVQYYRLRLDCLIQPEEILVIKEFLGTLEQIGALFDQIGLDEWWCGYYASTFNAWDKFRAGDYGAVHFVGYNVERLLTPVCEICRSGYLIDDVRWCCHDKFGGVMLANAKTVDANQVLLRDGNRYVRAARYRFEGLRFTSADRDEEWITYDGTSRGVPYMVDCSAAGTATSRLLVVEAEYDDPEIAVADMQAEGKFNYLQISRELFSGC